MNFFCNVDKLSSSKFNFTVEPNLKVNNIQLSGIYGSIYNSNKGQLLQNAQRKKSLYNKNITQVFPNGHNQKFITMKTTIGNQKNSIINIESP